MERSVEPADKRHELSLEKELLDAALCAAIETAHSRAGSRHWTIVRGFPVKIVVLSAFFLLSGAVAAALIHSGAERAVDSLFRLASF